MDAPLSDHLEFLSDICQWSRGRREIFLETISETLVEFIVQGIYHVLKAFCPTNIHTKKKVEKHKFPRTEYNFKKWEKNGDIHLHAKHWCSAPVHLCLLQHCWAFSGMWSEASSSTVFLHPQQSGEDYLPWVPKQSTFKAQSKAIWPHKNSNPQHWWWDFGV